MTTPPMSPGDILDNLESNVIQEQADVDATATAFRAVADLVGVFQRVEHSEVALYGYETLLPMLHDVVGVAESIARDRVP